MSAELHIKDSYYFELPKFMVRYNCRDKSEFPDVWVKNDPEYQEWQADRLIAELDRISGGKLPKDSLKADYLHWKEADHANFGKPLDVYLAEGAAKLQAEYDASVAKWAEKPASDGFEKWLSLSENADKPFAWFAALTANSSKSQQLAIAKIQASKVSEYKQTSQAWAPAKIAAYNQALSGKIILGFQPFGELKNLYEKESGFCISKFMVIEVAVAVVVLWLFSWLGRRVSSGAAPQGALTNMLEAFFLFIRDEVARKAIHDDHHGHGDEHGHGSADVHHGHDAGGHGAVHAVETHRGHGADGFVPVLATLFFFILGCNLSGMLPWVGSPTGSWGVTAAMAFVTFLTGLICGSKKFGVLGYWLNQIPSMDLPWWLAILRLPIFLIEVMGLAIKHAVLSIRLLANMIAGHVVLISIMYLAFSVEGAKSDSWTIAAIISTLGATALSVLELGVAFLQAYVFTFLSALFIGAATHKH